MTVCLDTGVFLQIFGRKQPFYPILRARCSMVESRLRFPQKSCWNIRKSSRNFPARNAGAMSRLLEVLVELHGNIRHIEPRFRFNVISIDPDDNKFCDCAIAAEANFIVAEDGHFDVLKSCRLQIQTDQAGRIHPPIFDGLGALF